MLLLCFKRLFIKFTCSASLHWNTDTNNGDWEWHHDHHKLSQSQYCPAQGHLWAPLNSCYKVTSVLKDGSLKDILGGSKPQQTYLKKYSSLGKHKSLQLNDIRSIGWQILKALEFLHSKGIPHGNISKHINLKPRRITIVRKFTPR